MKTKRQFDNGNFELKLANGKTQSFKSGYDMWKWTSQNNPKTEFKFDEKNGHFLCDYFDKLRKK